MCVCMTEYLDTSTYLRPAATARDTISTFVAL